MGMFIGHAGPGTFWLSIGLWHLYCTIRNYAKGPKNFRTRPWHPAKLPGSLRYMELYMIMFMAGMEIAMELFILPHRHQPWGDHWEIPANHLRNFEHSSMSFFFFLYALVALITETTGWLPLPWGGLNVLAAVAFSQEFLLFYFHSADHMGLEGQYHFLLLLSIGAGLVCTLLEILYPSSFNLPLLRAMSMVLQGTWFWQTAFSIFGGPAFVTDGCKWAEGPGDEVGIVCQSESHMHRGMALANLQFNWHLAVVLVGTLALFAYLMRKHNPPSYDLLLRSDSAEDLELQTKDWRGAENGDEPEQKSTEYLHVLEDEDEAVQAEPDTVPFRNIVI
eukprot:TRINITY_DN8832_c0_g1_i1.p1 TRINITY_DN8832_c0_g1~~TRINITY_DN8832_c0_g1_i1.p1  ORF type:complete len:334 (-),score=36.52 TRINITY_DN8832_c0_g1_i1:775-1776(-)